MNSMNLTFGPKESTIGRILLIDDDEEDYLLTRQMLAEARQGKFTLEWCATDQAGETRLAEDQGFDAVLIADGFGARSGVDLIRQAASAQYPAPLLLLTGPGPYPLEGEAAQAGAADVLSKSELTPALLERAIRYAIERKKQELSLRQSEANFRLCETKLRQSEANFRQIETKLRQSEANFRLSETNSRQIEAQLRQSEERYRASQADLALAQADLALAQEVSHTGSWRLDIARDELRWSDETYHIFGVPTGTQLSYGGFLTFVHPDDREEVDRAWKAALSGAPYDIEHRIYAGDQLKWVRERAILEFDAQGALRGGFGTVQDITELKQTEQAQRTAEKRFRIALSNTSIAVFSTGLDLRYTWFYSSAMGTMTEMIIGKRDDEILSPESAAEMMQLKRRALAEKAPVRDEIRLDMPVSNRVTLLVSVEPYYDEQGELIGVIGSGFDITHQRRLERENVDHLTEMEVHHHLMEFREKERQHIARELHDGPMQNLSGIIFHLQSLRESISDTSAQFELDSIRLQTSSVVNDLRKMMNELRPPALIRFGLGKAIQNHLQDLQENSPTIKVRLDLGETDPPMPENISLTLFRIYQEAVNNAIRHGEATTLQVRLRFANEQALLEVCDNGCGFAMPEDLGLQTKTGHFGLPGMIERADLIGGRLAINSQPGEGTTVQVVVPMRPRME